MCYVLSHSLASCLPLGAPDLEGKLATTKGFNGLITYIQAAETRGAHAPPRLPSLGSWHQGEAHVLSHPWAKARHVCGPVSSGGQRRSPQTRLPPPPGASGAWQLHSLLPTGSTTSERCPEMKLQDRHISLVLTQGRGASGSSSGSQSGSLCKHRAGPWA